MTLLAIEAALLSRSLDDDAAIAPDSTGTVAADPAGWTPALFRFVAARHADLPAIEGPRGPVTFGELDRIVERRAAFLRGLGVGRGVLVGLALRRSVDAVALMLATLRAGGAFLPLDPDYPRSRLAFLLKDSGVRLVIATPDVAPRLPVVGATVVTPTDLDAEGEDATDFEGEAGDLAYAIYTSGSTGRPKAALLSHRGIGPLAEAQGRAFGIEPGTRVLQFALLGFDASISEVLVTLLNGGTVCVADAAELVPGDALARTLRARRIEVATLPPSVLAALPKGPYPDLRTLVVAGEPCSGKLASHWSVGRRFLNAYGPTEATVCATLHHCPEGEQPSPPIGRPLPGFEVLVLDPRGRRTPDGNVGELVLGGPGLAIGYLNRPNLTAERFVRRPTPGDPARRLYRTGDRVRRRADGVLEFVGRVDDQVKIRGVRIEPGEVVAAIEQVPGVLAAAVVTEDLGGDRRLKAFAVAEPGSGVTADRIGSALRASLPIHLIPGAIVLVDRLPTTPHGKLDRRALTAVAMVGRGRSSSPQDPPRDPIEWQVAGVWAEVFGRSVGVSEDFFAIGGDSIGAMDLLAGLQRRLGAALTVSALMERPTVAGLAETIRRGRDPRSWSPLVSLQPSGDRPPLFCVHPGGGGVLCYAELSRALGPDRPFYGLQAPGVDPGRPPLRTVDAMAETYLDALRSAWPEGPVLLVGWSLGGVIAFEMARRLEAEGRPPARLVLLDAGFVYAFAVLRALIPSQRPLASYLGSGRSALFPEFRRHAIDAGIIPRGTRLSQARRIFEVFMANVEAMLGYSPGPYSGPVSLLVAAEPFAARGRDPREEWRGLCGDLEILEVPGNHLTMIARPHVDRIASILADRLEPIGRPEAAGGHRGA